MLDPKSPLEKWGTGYHFTEGPVYHSGVWYFTDFMLNKIYRMELGKVKLINDDSHFTIGMTYDRMKKRILCCTRDLRAITDLDRNVIVNSYNGIPINGSNDIIVDSKGLIYFTDPLSRKIEGVQVGHSSVFRYDESSAGLEMIEATLNYPNGLALSVEEKTLYIIDTSSYSIFQLDLTKKSLSLFFKMDEKMGAGKPDGMRLDERGNIYSTGPGGIWIISPDGTLLGHIRVPEIAANLCFDDTGLFITASTGIYHVDAKIRAAV
ncbi:MAG: SMP-30/gluconolactonase/LRE family protein [Treponemataceae bacterium]